MDAVGTPPGFAPGPSLPELRGWRLVPPAAAAWAAAWWGTAAPLPIVTVTFGVVTTAVLGLAVALRRCAGQRRAGSGRGGRGPLAATLLVAAAVLAVLGSVTVTRQVRSAGPIPGWAAERAVVEISGRVRTDPRAIRGHPSGEARYVLTVRSQQLRGRGHTVESTVPLLVIGGTDWGGLSVGENLRFVGRLAQSDPGDDVVAVAFAAGPPRDVRPGSWPWRAADRVRAGLRDACRGLTPDSRGLLPSLVVGDTSALPDRLVNDLRTAGLSHLTAVSGANVAIVVAAAIALSSRLAAPRRLRLLVAAASLTGFVVLARPEPSVLRAAAMAAVALLALVAGRRARAGPALSAVTILLLIADPWLARSPGFALSVAATTGLVTLAPAWTERLARRWPRPLAVAVAAPAAAQAACGPVLVLLDPSVPVVSVPANLLADPAVAPATVLGVLAAVTAPLSPGTAHLLVLPAAGATTWIAAVAHRAAALPLASVPWPAGLAGAALLGLLTATFITLTLRPTAAATIRRFRRGTAAVVVVLAATAFGWWLPRSVPLPLPGSGKGNWAVAMCDVGQGDALAVRSGPREAVLIDAGPEPEAIDRCLGLLRVARLDLVVLTHFHADHVAGLAGALDGRPTRAVLIDPLAEPADEATATNRTLRDAGVTVQVARAGTGGEVGTGPWRVQWQILSAGSPNGPAPRSRRVRAGPLQAGDDEGAANDSSIVLTVQVDGPDGRIRLLALGDLERPGQQRLTGMVQDSAGLPGGPVDAVKVAHHGSRSQDPELYRSIGARIALVSVGEHNGYGHPAEDTLAMLATAGMVLARSDQQGTVVLRPDGDELRLGKPP
jgi:competence protein ComEC